MFRRRKPELEDVKPIMETNDDLGLPGKPATRPGVGLSSGKAPVLPTQPPRPTDTVRPGIEMPRQVLLDHRWQDGDAILVALRATDDDLIATEVDILNTEPTALEQAQPRAIE